LFLCCLREGACAARRLGSGDWSGLVVAGYNPVLSAEKEGCVYKMAARDEAGALSCRRISSGGSCDYLSELVETVQGLAFG
jgi:hypothetical protein